MAYTHNRGFVTPFVAKRETTIGTDSTPTGTADAVQTYNASTPFRMSMETVTLNPHNSTLTSTAQDIPAQRVWNISTQFMLMGSGSAGVSAVNGYAGIAALLSAAGCKETTVVSTSLTYAPATIAQLNTPSTSSPKSGPATVWAEYEGKLHKAQSVWGNLVMSCGSRTALSCAFTGMGLYNVPTHASISSYANGTNRAKAALGANVFSITRSGGSAYNPRLISWSFDMGNRVVLAEDMNSSSGVHSIVLVNRNPRCSVRIGLDGQDGGNLDYEQIYADVTGQTDHALALAHGTGTGNTWAWAAATAQPLSITPVDGDLRMVDIAYKLYSTTAEGEWSLALT